MANLLLPAFMAIFILASGQELMQNSGFEQGMTGWHCWGIKCDIVTDHHGGSHAIRATQRKQYYQGPGQDVHVKGGHLYHVQAWVKLLNDNPNTQHIELMAAHTLSNGHINYDTISAQVPVTSSSGWVFLSGEMVVPPDVAKSQIYFQGPEPSINFMVDDVSMKELHISDGNWKAEANVRIDKLRKNNIHLSVTMDSGVQANAVSIEVSQTKHLFPFGTAVAASVMAKDNAGADQKYRQFIFDNYNWVVMENALKWNAIEYTRGHPDFSTGTAAIKKVRSHGIKVRGHNLIWSAEEKFAPHWLPSLPANEIKSEVHRHIQQTVTHYKGLVEHWDVNNEMLHGQFYENKFHDPDYSKSVFRLVHQYDPHVKLFLNEYDVVASGGHTEAYLAQAKDYKTSNTFIAGMGVQCHFSSIPVPTLVKQRLDRLSEAGIPLWATELDVMSDDVNQRADWYETLYRLLFSHSNIHGILTWGFWSQHHWRGEAASLVSGPNFTINAAGKRVLGLIKGEWWTKNIHQLSRGTKYTVRGFHGDYRIVVKVNGKAVQTKNISLGKGDMNVNLHVSA